MLCVCIADRTFEVAPRERASASIARLHDIRQSYDHVRRAVHVLSAATVDATLCAAALEKLRAVEMDLIEAFRQERAGTCHTMDDGSLGDADGSQTTRTV